MSTVRELVMHPESYYTRPGAWDAFIDCAWQGPQFCGAATTGGGKDRTSRPATFARLQAVAHQRSAGSWLVVGGFLVRALFPRADCRCNPFGTSCPATPNEFGRRSRLLSNFGTQRRSSNELHRGSG